MRNAPCESITQHGKHSGEHSLISIEEKEVKKEIIDGIVTHSDTHSFSSSHSHSHSKTVKQDCDPIQLDCNHNDIISLNDNKKKIILDIQKNRLHLNSAESSSSSTMEGIVSELFLALQSDKKFNNTVIE